MWAKGLLFDLAVSYDISLDPFILHYGLSPSSAPHFSSPLRCTPGGNTWWVQVVGFWGWYCELCCWLWPGLALVVVVIWGVKEPMKDLSLCLSNKFFSIPPPWKIQLVPCHRCSRLQLNSWLPVPGFSLAFALAVPNIWGLNQPMSEFSASIINFKNLGM